jgi:hypothetical protein
MVRIDVKVRPAEIKTGEDNGWFVTVSGIEGDAVAPPQGTTLMWGGAGSVNPGGQPPTGNPPVPTPGNPSPGKPSSGGTTR